MTGGMTPQPSEQPRTAAGQKLLRYLSGLEGGIEPPQWVKDMMASDILAIEAEAANGSALDVERLARALADQHLAWPKHWRDEDNLRWLARQIAAEYARLTSSPDPAALADRLVEEGRVSVWGRPGTKFTAKRAKAPEATDG